MLPDLIAAHSPLAVAIALALHVNMAAEQAVKSGYCTLAKAKLLFKELGALTKRV
jgi:hypothetical protein